MPAAAERFQEVLESTRDDVHAPQGVVWKAMWRAHGRVFMQAGAVKFCHDCILFIGALREAVSDTMSGGLRLSFHHPQITFLYVRYLGDGVGGHVASAPAHLHAGRGCKALPQHPLHSCAEEAGILTSLLGVPFSFSSAA